jgi:multiple sugar transport system substrate-binding protein
MKEKSNPRRKPVSRRDFLRLSGLVGGAAILAACAPSTAVPSAPPAGAEATQPPPAPEATVTATFVSANPAPSGDQVVIEWWNQFSTPTCQVIFPQIVSDFQKENPNILVKFEISGGPPGGGDYTQVLLARIAAGNPPDSITLWTGPSQYGALGSLLDIDNMMASAKYATKDSFYPNVLKSCQWNGKTYGLPASAGDGCIFINTQMFADAGVSTKREDFPTTWAGVKELSKKFTKIEGGETKQAGYVPFTGGSSWLKPVWSELNGGQIFDSKNMIYTIDSPQNAEWWSFWVQWLKDEYGGDIEKLNQSAGSGGWADVYPNTAFSMGRAAMADSGAWACTDAAIPVKWEVVKFPKGPSGSAMKTGFWPNWWALPKGTLHPQEAFLFSEYFCTKGWAYWYEQAIMDVPAWKKFPRETVNKALVNEIGAERATDVQNFLLDYLNDAAEMWTSPVESFASDTLNSALDEVLHLKKTPEQALKEAQTLVQAKLEETMKTS